MLDRGISSSRFWLALLCALLLSPLSTAAQEQSSTPQSTDTGQASPQTTQTADSVLQALKPLLEQALNSSISSDQNSEQLSSQIDNDNKQRIADDQQRQQEQAQRQQEQAQRQKEQQASSDQLATLSLQATTLQSYFDALSSSLTDFSGSEAEKEKAALAAVDKIKSDAKAVELQIGLFKVGYVTFGIIAVGESAYIAGHLLGWWK